MEHVNKKRMLLVAGRGNTELSQLPCGDAA